MRTFRFLCILILACQMSCSEDESPAIERNDPSVMAYSGGYDIRDLYWVNNETIFIAEAYGRLKRINTSSKEVVSVVDLHDYYHLFQSGFYSPQVPDSYFYVAIKYGENGSFSSVSYLFRLDLLTMKVQQVADSLHHPDLGGYVSGNSHLAIQKPGSEFTLLVNLKSLAVKKVNFNGTLTAFAPDDQQALILNHETQTFTTFDLNNHSFHPVQLKAAGTSLWRKEGLFGADLVRVGSSPTIPFPDKMFFWNMTSGENIGTMDRIINWNVSSTGTLVALFAGSPFYDDDQNASIMTYDLVTKAGKRWVTVKYHYEHDEGMIHKLTISPDQGKIAFVYNSGAIKIVKF